MDQKPSIGRVVHYKSYGTPNGEYSPKCRAAIITEVIDKDDHGNPLEGVVALAVLNPEGMFFNQVVMHDEADQKGGTWHWPERV